MASFCADSHCHLQDDRIDGDIVNVLVRARGAGVCWQMCCGTAESDWDEVMRISAANRDVAFSLGVHPWYVAGISAVWADRLAEGLSRGATGIGEIGLDFAVHDLDRGRQESVFVEQLRLANRLGLPVSIHCRQAWGRMLELLDLDRPVAGGLIHSYSGGPGQVAAVQGLGLHLSFSGTITRSRNRRGRDACVLVDPLRLLVETDSPDLPPAGCDERPNEPANLPVVIATVAELRSGTADEIAGLTSSNHATLFGRRSG